MDDNWLDQHVGPETRIRPEFEEDLAATLVSTWRDEPVVTLARHDRTVRRRPWQAIGWSAAVVVLLAAVGAVIATRPEPLGGSVDVRLPATSLPDPLPSTVPITDPSAPAPATTEPGTAEPAATVPATSEPATSGPPPTSAVEVLPTDLLVPGIGGRVVEPAVLATIPAGTGPGELVLQNGEFTIPIAVLPDSILIVEDHPFQGFTGRVLELDRNGQWQRDLTIDAPPEAGIVGATPLGIEASPNGTVFVSGIVQQPDGEGQTSVWALRVDGDRLRPTHTVSFPGLRPGRLHITPEGASLGDEMVLFLETGVEPDDVTTAMETPPAVDRVVLTRGTGTTAETWMIDVALVGDPGTVLASVGDSGPLGEGAWFASSMRGDPLGNGPFFAVLGQPDAENVWFGMGPWGSAGADGDQLIFTRVTVDGLEIAVWPTSEQAGTTSAP